MNRAPAIQKAVVRRWDELNFSKEPKRSKVQDFQQ